jgi:DNA polymerase-1
MLERQGNGNEIGTRILEYRGWQKGVSGYYQPYQSKLSHDGRLRAEYKSHGTVTGRFSCADPNLQQIPKETDKEWNREVKGCLIGGIGKTLWELDYSQLEFRLAASAAKEDRLLGIFNDPTRDIFTEMAGQLGMQRQDTKTLTYTILYGGGVLRIKDVFGADDDKAAEIIDNFYSTYPQLRNARMFFGTRAKSDGYVEIWSGRRRHFRFPKEEHYKAFNSYVQGGAADLVKQVMVNVDRDVCNSECSLLLQVHDSLVFEIENGREEHYLPRIAEIMTAPQFGVHLEVDSHRWSK